MRPMAPSRSSSEVRSCISFCALGGSFQRLGSSASLFSSASRAVDVSTSKMPPQQPDRLLDLFDEFLDFSAHRFFREFRGDGVFERSGYRFALRKRVKKKALGDGEGARNPRGLRALK